VNQTTYLLLGFTRFYSAESREKILLSDITNLTIHKYDLRRTQRRFAMFISKNSCTTYSQIPRFVDKQG
jgi:hypothetical protein